MKVGDGVASTRVPPAGLPATGSLLLTSDFSLFSLLASFFFLLTPGFCLPVALPEAAVALSRGRGFPRYEGG